MSNRSGAPEAEIVVERGAGGVLRAFLAHLQAEDDRDGEDARARAFSLRLQMLKQECGAGRLPQFVRALDDDLHGFDFLGFLFVFELRSADVPPGVRILSLTPPAGLLAEP